MKKKSGFQIYGLFGYPLSHSLSPVIQECAFNRNKILAHYLLFEIAPSSIHKIFKQLKKQSIDGFNLTVPYKETIMPFLDEVSQEAQLIGAVNSVYRKGDKWLGANTDVYGFLTALEKEVGYSPANKTICVFGAGGAAKAVVYGLLSQNAKKIFLINRTLNRAEQLKKRMAQHFPKAEIEIGCNDASEVAKAIAESSLIVNTTSVGLKKSDSKLFPSTMIPKASTRSKKIFYDLIYFPKETNFLKEAKKKGHLTLNGAGMLVYQGAKAFELWTKQVAPVEEMKKVFHQALEIKKESK